MDTVRYTLVWFSMDPMDASKLTPVRRQIEDEVKEPRESVEIDVWLESPGGDAHAAYKLALMLRAAAGKIRVVVPDYAKSAATLLALAGDEIYMAPGTELGPLDGQMLDEGSVLGYISALNIAKAADDVARDAVELAIRGGAKLITATGLKREQTLEAMLRFVATFSEPLVRQLDPRLVHDAKQTLRVTKLYAERLLAQTLPRSKAADVASSLVENYPSHGFVIAYDEAVNLGLPVFPIGEYDRREPLQALHRRAEDGNTMIKLIKEPHTTGEGDHSGLAEDDSADSKDNEADAR